MGRNTPYCGLSGSAGEPYPAVPSVLRESLVPDLRSCFVADVLPDLHIFLVRILGSDRQAFVERSDIHAVGRHLFCAETPEDWRESRAAGTDGIFKVGGLHREEQQGRRIAKPLFDGRRKARCRARRAFHSRQTRTADSRPRCQPRPADDS